MAEEHTAICRFCHAFCGIRVTVEDGRATKIVGDKHNPMYHGYTCVKGRQLPQQHYNPERVLHTLKRGDLGHAPILPDQALDEMAEKLKDIIDVTYIILLNIPYPLPPEYIASLDSISTGIPLA